MLSQIYLVYTRTSRELICNAYKVTTDRPQSVARDVIDHVHKKSPEPKGLDDLVAWFEDDGWDEIVGAWSDERVVLKLDDLAQLKFEDYEFRAHEGVEGEITDDLRIAFARREIDQTLESGDGYSCPSVHAVKLEDDTNQFALLGWMVEIHGQGGHVQSSGESTRTPRNFTINYGGADYYFPKTQSR